MTTVENKFDKPLPCKDAVESASVAARALEKQQEVSTTQWHKALCLVALEIYLLKVIVDQSKEMENPFAATSWVYPLVGTVCYLSFVYFGKRYMANREPMVVRQYMIMYNLYQTAFNIYVVVCFFQEIIKRQLPVAGTKFVPGPHEFNVGFLIYAHYQNKYLELLDTVFMVVRKKNKQISFLHVYHHTLLIWSWYAVLVTNPGGDAYFGALANSIIHVVMYSYYLMALLGVPCPWKKYVTIMQLIQFCVVFSQGLYVMYLGSSPLWLVSLQQFVMVNMLVLFGNFYMKSYKKKSEAAKKQQ